MADADTPTPAITSTPAGKHFRTGKSHLSACALIIGVALLAYHNILPNAFVFDDIGSIVGNAHIRHLWPPWDILTHTARPVVTLSLAVNYSLGALNPWGYHVFNVMVHTLAALTLYGLVRRTLLGERVPARFGTAATGLALAVALLWAVHPLQTESVTYTFQRAESLMGLFYLLTLYCVARSRDSARTSTWQMAAVASCALGMASKEVMISAPVVMLLYDRAYWAHSWNEIWRRRWRLYVGLMATWLLLPILRAAPPEIPELREPSAGFAFKGITPGDYALTQPGVILHYLRLSFWPHPLIVDHGWHYGWPLARSVGDALPELLVVGGLLMATVWAWRRRPELGFLGAWFFMILAITSSFMPIADVIFEHRMYLSLAAVVTLTVLGGFGLTEYLAAKGQNLARCFVWSAGGMSALFLTMLTIQRNYDYRSELTIWQDTVRKCPSNPRAHNSLGVALHDNGEIDEAISEYREGIRLKPDDADAHNNLGLALYEKGQIEEAINHYQEAIRLKPDHAYAHNNLGNALGKQGQIDAAISHYQEAIRLEPDYAYAHNNLGNALGKQGQIDAAISHYREAIHLEPEYANAHYNLGIILYANGQIDEAIKQFQETIRLKPNDADLQNNLGVALEKNGQIDEAISHYQEAIRLKPDQPYAHNNLAHALQMKSAQAGR